MEPLSFEQKVSRKVALIQRHSVELRKMLDECPHNKLEHRTDYFSGGYNDVAHTDYWDECVVCGKRFNKHTKDHSWFG
jgi:nitrite reductase/ring-hydroxylating ferredoxin subunit